MKRMFCLLLAVLLLLTGCQLPTRTPVPEETVAETEAIAPVASEPVPEEPTETEPVRYEQQVMFAISMPFNEEVFSDEDGNTIFSHTYQDMHLAVQHPDIADNVIIDYLNRLDEVHALAEEFRDNAQSAYSAGDDWSAHYYDIYYSPERIDREVLSLYGISTSYTGGRPAQVCSAINYSMLTGEVLTLGSILSHIDAKAQLVELVIQAADGVKQDVQLFDDYADCIADRFEKEESYDEDWYFTDTGLCFYFSAYEIAPYSSGIVTLDIPYSELTGIIADDFFPPEEDQMVGNILGQRKSEADLTGYTQVAEVILNDAGEQFLLYADGAVLDVQIEFGSWNEDAMVFTPTCTVFACNSLTPGDGIMLQADIPDTMPNLRISYRSGEEIYAVYLSQSGKDGSALLIE